MLTVMLGNQQNLIGKIIEGYNGARFWTHKKGPPPEDKTRPPNEDLVGPQPFKCGLRLQCGMTSTIAVIFIYCLLKCSMTSSAPEAFISPHGLMFASENGDRKFNQTVKVIAAYLQITRESSIESWFTVYLRQRVHSSQRRWNHLKAFGL